MKNVFKFLVAVTVVFAFMLAIFESPEVAASNPEDCVVDTSHIAVVEFTVFGMDSLTIDGVQDMLDTTCGVNFNFACWSDTVVFVEYDSLLTDKFYLMSRIKDMGFVPSIRSEY